MVSVPRLSIVVPYQPSAQPFEKLFEDTLASVLQNRPSDCEVVVPHAGDYADPYELRGEVRFLEQPLETPLVELLNAGLDRVRGELLHVLMPGQAVQEGWTEEPVAAFDDPRVGSISPVVVSAADPHKVLHCGVGYGVGGARWLVGAGRTLQALAARPLQAVGPSLTAAFYRTDAVCSLDGFSVAVGEALTDVDLALGLHAVGYTTGVSLSSVVRSELPALREASSFQAGREAELLFRRHARHLGLVRSLLAHPLTVLVRALGDLPHPGAVTQLLGRAAAWREGRSVERYRELLADAIEEASLETSGTLPLQQPSDDRKSATRRAA